MLKAAFIALSENRALRQIAERSSIGHLISSRFVAGTTVEEALRATQEINSLGMSVSLDNLGENVTTARMASEALTAPPPAPERPPSEAARRSSPLTDTSL